MSDSMTFQFSSLSVQSRSEFVIGIDFGTTYTGVAYAHSSKAVNAETLEDSVRVIKSWPDPRHSFSEKTPTVLAYNKNPPLWGGSVKSRDEPQVAHFKLGLPEGMGAFYAKRAGSESAVSALSFLDPNWRHPQLPQKTPLDYTTDYLTAVLKFVREVYFPSKYGNTFLRNQQLSYVITVPAIWKDAAKNLTRQAAVHAGIPEAKLELITEPEAAALYCATIGGEVDLQAGERFLVCDAGGGTVDLIAYEVISQSPFSVKECSVGTGALCGAVFLHKAFESLIRRKLGSRSNSILTDKRLKEAMKYFENSVKREFNPFDESCEPEFDVPMGNAKDIPSIGLEDGFLKVSRDEMKTVFLPIFGQIHDLINEQIKDVEQRSYGGLRTLLLVGGFGSNQYMYRYLKDKLSSRISIKQPCSGYTAIMRGAVLHKMGLHLVKERLMRRHYGVEFYRHGFKNGEDPPHLRATDASGEELCKEVMNWYATKGQKMPNGQVVKFPFVTRYAVQDYENTYSFIVIVDLLSSDLDIGPKYKNSSVDSLCSVTVDLTPLKPFTRKVGKLGHYYEIDYDLSITFGPELLFKLERNGRVMGSATAKYH